MVRIGYSRRRAYRRQVMASGLYRGRLRLRRAMRRSYLRNLVRGWKLRHRWRRTIVPPDYLTGEHLDVAEMFVDRRRR